MNYPCLRCGQEQEVETIECFGGARYPVPMGCPCPRPYCPLSGGPLDYRGRCTDIGCVLLLNVVPIPEMR